MMDALALLMIEELLLNVNFERLPKNFAWPNSCRNAGKLFSDQFSLSSPF